MLKYTRGNISHTVSQHTGSHCSEFIANGSVQVQFLRLFFSKWWPSRSVAWTGSSSRRLCLRTTGRVLTQSLPVCVGKRWQRNTAQWRHGVFASSLGWKHKALFVLFPKSLMSFISHMHSSRVIMMSIMLQSAVVSRKTSDVHRGPTKEPFNKHHHSQMNSTRSAGN